MFPYKVSIEVTLKTVNLNLSSRLKRKFYMLIMSYRHAESEQHAYMNQTPI